MMTSFAFILGLVPLVIASGAGAATQRAVGTAVFGGMIAASFLGIFVIPGLYVSFQTFREKVKGQGRNATKAASRSNDNAHYDKEKSARSGFLISSRKRSRLHGQRAGLPFRS